MSDLRELYQQVILDHNKNPRNFHELAHPTRTVDGYNPLCGDHDTISVEMDGETIKDIGFTRNGCAISRAWASVMSSKLKGETTQDAHQVFDVFHELWTAASGRISEAELA